MKKKKTRKRKENKKALEAVPRSSSCCGERGDVFDRDLPRPFASRRRRRLAVVARGVMFLTVIYRVLLPADDAKPVATGTAVWSHPTVGVVYSVCAWPQSYDHRPSHPYHAGKEHVGISPTRQTLLAPSAKRRAVFGESHEG